MRVRRPQQHSRRRARGAASLGAALTLYSTWPAAQSHREPPRPTLALALEISRAVEAYTHNGPPLALAASHALTEAAPPPYDRRPPLRLALAGAIARPPEADMRRMLEFGDAQPVFYAVRLNGEEVGIARLLRLPDGRLLVRRADLESWRLQVPVTPPIVFRNEEHYPLDAYRLLALRVDDAQQALEVEVAAQAFAGTTVQSGLREAPPAAAPVPGGFVNYDLFLNATSAAYRLDGLLETAFFNRFGVGTSGFLAQDATEQPRLIRLETAWRRDFPGAMTSLIVGDAIGSSGLWGRPVRFGGLSYGTNFGTNPGFVTFPLPGFAGEATLPTTTELYVDGALRQNTRVPPGPFRIDNVPVVTGQGELRVVVRDLLGREQIVSLPYYASSALLRAGLTEASYQVGAVRNNFGLRSHDYGRALVTGQHRKGYSPTVTAEVRAELLADQQTAGAGASVLFPRLGVLSAAGAVSHAREGEGALAFAGFERQNVRGVSFGARSQWTTREFTQLGFPPDRRAPARLLSGNVGYAPAGLGSFGVAYVREDSRDQPGVEIVSGSYSVSLGRSSALVLFAFKPLKDVGGITAGATFTMALGARSSAAVSYTRQPGADPLVAQVQQNPPAGPGVGYRLLAGTLRGGRQEAGVSVQTDIGTYGVEAGRAGGVTAARASASGAVAVLDGRAFLARTLTESFAVAHVPGFRDVGIYVNNQVIARTDPAGYALLPHLLPYQNNPVRVDTADLPLDSRIDAAELDAVPYYRSGLLLRFPIARAFGALLELRLEDGGPMPAGSTVRIAGAEARFPVAERGEAYVTGLTGPTRLIASWRDQDCELEVDLGAEREAQPRIGPLVCAGVLR